MSGVGLREERREAAVLLTLILAALPLQPRWCHREQARSHRGMRSIVGVSLLAMGTEQAPQHQGLGIVATMEGR